MSALYKFTFSFLLSVSFFNLSAQATGTLKGIVSVEKETDGIPGVIVHVPTLKIEKYTDDKGNYELELPNGIHEISFSFPAYATIIKQVQIDTDQTAKLDLKLYETAKLGFDPVRLKNFVSLPELTGSWRVIDMIPSLEMKATLEESQANYFAQVDSISSSKYKFLKKIIKRRKRKKAYLKSRPRLKISFTSSETLEQKVGFFSWYDGCNGCGHWNYRIISKHQIEIVSNKLAACTAIGCRPSKQSNLFNTFIISFQAPFEYEINKNKLKLKTSCGELYLEKIPAPLKL